MFQHLAGSTSQRKIFPAHLRGSAAVHFSPRWESRHGCHVGCGSDRAPWDLQESSTRGRTDDWRAKNCFQIFDFSPKWRQIINYGFSMIFNSYSKKLQLEIDDLPVTIPPQTWTNARGNGSRWRTPKFFGWCTLGASAVWWLWRHYFLVKQDELSSRIKLDWHIYSTLTLTLH